MRFGKAVLIAIGVLALISLTSVTSILVWRHSHAVATKPDVRSSWITTGDHKKPFVVVFVHGIFGDDKSFKNGEAEFTSLVANDERFSSTTDVYSFRYSTPYFGDAANVVSLASELRGALDDSGISSDPSHQHIIFVAHSMGGIVVRLLLLTDPSVVSKISLMYFYATPMNGSDLADPAHRISKNPQLRALLPLQGNDLLQTISDIWDGSDLLKSIPAHCGYETLPTEGGIFVVKQESARALCNTQVDALPGNHITIVKPPDRDDPRYSRFATALKRVEASTPTAAGTYYRYEFSVQDTPCIGVYKLKLDGTWREETISDHPCPTGQGFDFQQVPSATGEIVLRDSGRGVYIRLPTASDGSALYAQSATGPWGAIHVVHRVQDPSGP